MEEWDKHFSRLLGEAGWRVMRREYKIGRKDEKREIKKREISRVIRSLKEKKRRGLTGY